MLFHSLMRVLCAGGKFPVNLFFVFFDSGAIFVRAATGAGVMGQCRFAAFRASSHGRRINFLVGAPLVTS
jgi:hypothetical protein